MKKLYERIREKKNENLHKTYIYTRSKKEKKLENFHFNIEITFNPFNAIVGYQDNLHGQNLCFT